MVNQLAQLCQYTCTVIMALGFIFFGLLYMMAMRENEVFLEHKANGVENVQGTKFLTLEMTIVSYAELT